MGSAASVDDLTHYMQAVSRYRAALEEIAEMRTPILARPGESVGNVAAHALEPARKIARKALRNGK